MQKAYKLSVIYYLAFTALLILSAIMLFANKIGFFPTSIIQYYIGNEEKFIPAKDTIGILKTILPHIFVFGLISMVLLHFLVFTKHKQKTITKYTIYFTYILAFCELFVPFMILNGYEFFAYVKLFCFVGFLTIIVYVSWLLFYSITFD